MRNIFLLNTLFILGCSSTVNTTIFKSYAANTSNEPIKIYQPTDQIPSNLELIGTISIGDSGVSVSCGWDTVLNKAKEETKRKGGTAIKFTYIYEPGISSTCYRAEGKILRDRFHGQKRNPNCQTDQVYKVFQVIEKAALANLCQGSPDDNMPLCIGHTVLIPQVTGNVYYDDQLIKLKENECAIYSGTIEYETVSGSKKTVPVVKIIDARMNVD